MKPVNSNAISKRVLLFAAAVAAACTTLMATHTLG